MLSFTADAQDVVTFRVTAPDGSVKEYALDDINRLAFGDETFVMIFNNNAPDETFRYDDVLRMTFGEGQPTAVQNVTGEDEEMRITYDGSLLRIDGCEGRVMIYDISGRPVAAHNVNGSAEISTEQLMAGVYILRTNNKTFKFSKL